MCVSVCMCMCLWVCICGYVCLCVCVGGGGGGWNSGIFEKDSYCHSEKIIILVQIFSNCFHCLNISELAQF